MRLRMRMRVRVRMMVKTIRSKIQEQWTVPERSRKLPFQAPVCQSVCCVAAAPTRSQARP